MILISKEFLSKLDDKQKNQINNIKQIFKKREMDVVISRSLIGKDEKNFGKEVYAIITMVYYGHNLIFKYPAEESDFGKVIEQLQKFYDDYEYEA